MSKERIRINSHQPGQAISLRPLSALTSAELEFIAFSDAAVFSCLVVLIPVAVALEGHAADLDAGAANHATLDQCHLRLSQPP